MSYADGHSIFTTIKPYIAKYQTIFDFPLLKYIINPDFDLNYTLEDLHPLHACYNYYKNKFETLESTTRNCVGCACKAGCISCIGKHNQTHHIAEFINKYCILEDKTIHETCCGYSVLGETLLDASKNTKLIGYDINPDLLIKNTKHFEHKLNKTKLNNPIYNNTNTASFKLIDLLSSEITFENTGSEITTCLHGCGQLHRNLITSMITQKYNGAFFIIPCCYHKFTANQYKLFNYSGEISSKLLKTVALSSNDTATLTIEHKHSKQLLMNIKANLLVKYLIANNLIAYSSLSSTTAIDYFIGNIKEYGYFTLKKIPYNDTDENNWNKIFKIIFESDLIKYSMYENVINNQHTKALQILDKILFEKHNILVQLSKLIEWLIMIDNVIYIQSNMPNHNVQFEQFISVANTPRNLIICGIPN
jgi:hypothetical protein